MHWKKMTLVNDDRRLTASKESDYENDDQSTHKETISHLSP